MVLSVDLIAALVKVGRRKLGRKCVQAEIVEFLGIQGERNRSSMLRADVRIELRVGIEALKFGVSLIGRKAVHGRVNKPVFEGLREGEAAFDQRSSEGWGGRGLPILATELRDDNSFKRSFRLA